MSWFSELFKLAKMPFGDKPSGVIKKGEIDTILMKHFPMGDYDFMMWCGKIIIRQGGDSDIVTDKVRNHETIHLYQAMCNHKDSWFRYYLGYLRNWLKLNPLVHPGSAAYYCNKYEVEAYANETNYNYTLNYTTKSLNGKYNIKHAKKIFRRMGCNVAEWKYYIKSL